MKENIEILIAENSKTQAEKLKYFLETNNFNVQHANDGEDFLISKVKDIFRSIESREDQIPESGFEIVFADQKYLINSTCRQAIDLLLSANENAVKKSRELDEANKELVLTQHKLNKLNENLEEEVNARTQKIDHLNAVLRAIRNVNQLIVKEKNRKILIKKACKNFIETRGFHSAWIALFDDDGKITDFAGEGGNIDISNPDENFLRDYIPYCLKEVLKADDIVLIEDIESDCKGCFWLKLYKEGKSGSIILNLKYGEKNYGILNISLPARYLTDKEEQSLFKEIAEDIAFGLYSMELEEKRKQAEEKYQVMFEMAKDAVFMSDETGKFIDVNQMACKSLGYSKEELLKLSNKEIDTDHRGYEAFLKIRNGAEEQAKFEMNQQRKDGTLLPVEIVGNFFTSGGQRIALAIARDITEQKKLEEQFRQSQKMEAIGTLAGGVAHDFNNLLTVIIGNAHLALMDDIKDESLRKGIEEIKKAGNRAASLIKQLLAFSRKQIITHRVLDFNELLTGIEKMLVRLIGEDVELLTILEPALWQVEMDPGQVEQVIMNLAVNARDAMPRGGKLTIETANMELDENYFYKHSIEEKPGHYAILTVSDTGSGMDEKIKKHIFDPFFTTKEVGKGTGLGLSTVYGIVKQNNGFVWVYSEPGQGSTFKVYLPRAKGDADLEEKQRFSVVKLDGSETILIVEDDYGLRRFAQEVLLLHGYKVLDAENGEDALMVSQAHEGQIHLMITDVVMPKMGGKEVAKRLQPLYPWMKVIYMSGYTDSAIVEYGVLSPGLNFFQKPFSPEGLAHKVRQVLDEGSDDGTNRPNKEIKHE